MPNAPPNKSVETYWRRGVRHLQVVEFTVEAPGIEPGSEGSSLMRLRDVVGE